MSVIHKNIYVYGHVQGVSFRASGKKIAEDLGVSGIIRNEPDGRVYVEAEGEEEKVNSFAYWCNEGPSGARVRGLEITEGKIKGYTQFEIIR